MNWCSVTNYYKKAPIQIFILRFKYLPSETTFNLGNNNKVNTDYKIMLYHKCSTMARELELKLNW